MQHEEYPRISIIIPTYNCVSTLETCLTSVREQDYSNLELICIDGGSADGTIELLKKHGANIDYWVSEPDNGIYDAMNKGIDVAGGEWLYFLGADDCLFNAKVLKKVFDTPDIKKLDVIYGNVQLKHSELVYDGKFTSQKLMHKNICHQAVFVRKSYLLSAGKFFTKYHQLADWVFNMIWFTDKKVRRKYVNIIIALFNEQGRSSANVDGCFYRDKDTIIRKHFSIIDRLRYAFEYIVF